MEPQSKKTRLACDNCGQNFRQKAGLSRHRRTVHGNKRLKCDKCKSEFTRRDNYLRHMKRHRQVGGASPETTRVTSDNQQTTSDNQQDEEESCLVEEALNGTMRTYAISSITTYDPMTYLRRSYDVIKKRIEESLLRGGIKWYLSLQVRFSRRRGDATETVEPHFRGKCHVTLKVEDVDWAMRETIKKIYNSYIEYQRQGSNWTLDKILGIKLHVARYRPLRGSSYIPLPVKLRTKHAIVNVQNRDNRCFAWSVLAALHPTKRDAERVSKYKDHVAELDFTGISFPIKMTDVPKAEQDIYQRLWL